MLEYEDKDTHLCYNYSLTKYIITHSLVSLSSQDTSTSPWNPEFQTRDQGSGEGRREKADAGEKPREMSETLVNPHSSNTLQCESNSIHSLDLAKEIGSSNSGFFKVELVDYWSNFQKTRQHRKENLKIKASSKRYIHCIKYTFTRPVTNSKKNIIYCSWPNYHIAANFRGA